MKLRIQRLFALLTALVLCVGTLALSASAAGSVTSTGTIWTKWAQEAPDWLGTVIGVTCDSVCSSSPDKLHHGKVIDKNPLGINWIAVCDYCSDRFPVYDDDMQTAYNEHVGTVQESLGTVVVGLNGYIIPLIPTKTNWSFDSYTNALYPQYSHFVYSNDYSSLKNYSFDPGYGVSFKDLAIPSVGYISLLYDASTTGGTIYLLGSSLIKHNGVAQFFVPFYPEKMTVSSGDYFVGDFFINVHDIPSGLFTVTYRLALLYEPASYSVNNFTQNIGGSGSRVGTYSGNFGYYGNDGQLVVGENVKIVDETNNNYYNPTTGTTTPITNWTYDYSDRSYNLTLESGDTVSVTYGDENVIIKEGDTTYNVYYIVQGGGSGGDPTPSPSPSTHAHDYTATVTTEPSCLTAGVKTYTCSVCGDTYTEKIPATGHTWVLDRTVNTTYDENGNVTQQGYTIYKCSVCGNEYKDETGSGPPDGGGSSGGGGILDKLGELLGSIFGGILSVLGSAIEAILDALIAIVNGVADKLGVVVDALFKVFAEIPGIFTGFTDFMSAVFAFVPPEIITIITFGILAVVLVAIIKHFIK